MINTTVLIPVKQAEVALIETYHYRRRQEQRKFETSILGKVVPLLGNIKVGQLAKFTDGKVAVICRRISAFEARLITGYNIKQALTQREYRLIEHAYVA